MVIKDKDRINDYYAELARKEGYPARSVYKLKEIDLKRKLFLPSQSVLDLGCFPGSWSLYASKKVKRVVGVDLFKPTIKMPDNFSFFECDILEGIPEIILELSPFQLVLSDLAPKTSGDRDSDSLKSLELAEGALVWAHKLLQKGGCFLFKSFQGRGSEAFLNDRVKPQFQKVELHKPKAVRKKSVEIYSLCLGFKGEGE